MVNVRYNRGMDDPFGARAVLNKSSVKQDQQMQIHMHIQPVVRLCENAKPSEGLKIACRMM